jgi:sugar phosphate isomerase/epimerase
MATQISLQTFTVRKYMNNDKQIEQTFRKLHNIGIRNLELAYIKWSHKEIKLIKSLCEDLDMGISSSQITYKRIIHEYEDIVAYHQLLECQYIAVSVLPNQYILRGEEGIRQFAGLLNQLGEKLLSKGLYLLYHHHHMEFARYGKRTGLEIMMEATNPRYVNLMMDTYWTQKGGKNPLSFIHQFQHRIKVIHIRDYKVELSLFKANYVESDCALGEGNLDIVGIMKTAIDYKVPYLSIEQDTSQPFEEILCSVNYVKNNGFSDCMAKHNHIQRRLT